MLTREEAAARLAEWRLPEDENRLAQEVAGLPATLRELAEDVFSLGEHDPRERHRSSSQAGQALDELSTSRRARLFAAVAPKLVPAMEWTWQLLKTTPYHAGFRAFRAPGQAHLAAHDLCLWLRWMGAVCGRYRAEALRPSWLAAWAPHIDQNRYGFLGNCVGSLLAAVLYRDDAEAGDVFEILRQSLTNEHEIGAPGRHIYTALLLADRPEGWKLMERTLLAAQRQEGTRQAILETVHLAHPEAFRRMLRLILEHDLVRFSSVVRAVDLWFGQLWAAPSTGVVKRMLVHVIDFLENDEARQKALAGKDAEAAFLALWSQATTDAVASTRSAERLMRAKSVELRYVAATHLVNLGLEQATVALTPALDDADLRIAQVALAASVSAEFPPLELERRFAAIERLVERASEKPQTLKPLVWPWTGTTLQRSQVAGCLVRQLGHQSATKLIPYLPMLEPLTRSVAVAQLVSGESWDQVTRTVVLTLAGDAVTDVRGTCMAALGERGVLAEEIPQLEGYLTRKASDVRCGVLALLLKQSDADALASGERLLRSKDAGQRLAGLELLRLLADTQRVGPECRRLAAAYAAQRGKLTQAEIAHLTEIGREKHVVASLDDGLGLINVAERTPVVPPRKRSIPIVTPAAIACLKALEDLVHKHRETPVELTSYLGESRQELLGTIRWGFPRPNPRRGREDQTARLPLADVWLNWNQERGDKLRDADGLELLRASFWRAMADDEWTDWAKSSPARRQAADLVSGGQQRVDLRYPIVGEILEWLQYLAPVDGRELLLDAWESALALVPTEEMTRLASPQEAERSCSWGGYEEIDWRTAPAFEPWSRALTQHLWLTGERLTPTQTLRSWRLQHWCDQPIAGAKRRRVDEMLLLEAYSLGGATLADVADHLLGPRGVGRYGSDEGFGLLSAATARTRNKDLAAWLDKHPAVQDLIDRAVDRILELELSRGDAPTAATVPALAVSRLTGTGTLRRILSALGKSDFKTGSSWRSEAREERRFTLTALARACYPAPSETPADFKRMMTAAVAAQLFPAERLLQLVFLAPQWTKHVEAYLGWKELSEGVSWFLAHMGSVAGLGERLAETDADEDAAVKPGGDPAEAEDLADEDDLDRAPRRLSAWERLIVERTPLSDAERNEGAIDVAWFQRTYKLLGAKRWQRLAAAARFAANSAQARHAQFIADVLLDRVSRKTLVDGIEKKQLKDHVRLLGLLPLAKGKQRAADLAQRCRVLREYRRYANQLSGLTKPAALRAWEIGMKNLAQMAGYPDPLRLEWAVGGDAVKDLASGAVTVAHDGVSVSLALDDLAQPQLSVCKAGKSLKSIPPPIKKHKQVAALTGRMTDLKRQATAMRSSLEAAMCRGDEFTDDELRQWCTHALLAPLLGRLVVVGEGIVGYPDKLGKVLRDFSGELEPVKANERLRLAHPSDLLESGHWSQWQHECFRAERMQPFKQVFRELYLLTKQERKDRVVSHRYAGQQVQPQQALALFGARGWDTRDGVFKVFHHAGLTAAVDFQCGVTTPLEVEGWTLAGVRFTRRDDWKPVPLESLAPRLFSEVMRDLDLVVSVAHAGGLDPEASASTVEMRAGLVRETCALLQLNNVRLKAAHAIVDGELANYSVHLGSGVVHKLPGGSLCIVPVHSQHRGRLFLPFADDDPRTAEVVSKILLLARDREIQDPAILEQIRA